ncbi:MAG: hypothetical protein U5R31_17330 [Acidimicrobiia bacterium]|nr:hypothetical protein [Acidimicrobiia bacterium]
MSRGVVEPVACPGCEETFTERPALEAHLNEVHGVRIRAHRERVSRLRRWWRSLGFLPLWFVLPLDILAVVIVATWIWPADRWLAVFAGGLATFPTVLVLSARVFRHQPDDGDANDGEPAHAMRSTRHRTVR